MQLAKWQGWVRQPILLTAVPSHLCHRTVIRGRRTQPWILRTNYQTRLKTEVGTDVSPSSPHGHKERWKCVGGVCGPGGRPNKVT